jgi:hypothetical protein
MAGLMAPSPSTSCRRHVANPAASAMRGTLVRTLGFMPLFYYKAESRFQFGAAICPFHFPNRTLFEGSAKIGETSRKTGKAEAQCPP